MSKKKEPKLQQQNLRAMNHYLLLFKVYPNYTQANIFSSPGPKPFSPKPKTKGPWANTKML